MADKSGAENMYPIRLGQVQYSPGLLTNIFTRSHPLRLITLSKTKSQLKITRFQDARVVEKNVTWQLPVIPRKKVLGMLPCTEKTLDKM